MTDKRVCIIGAGPSGIAAAKVLKENNISFDCFEKGSKIGGVWRFNNDNGLSAAYKSLHINTNRMVMAYSDFPMPESFPMFPHHSQIIRYFEDYVAHFKFGSQITFNTSVEKIEPSEGGYLVTLHTGEKRQYEKIIVANGHHWNPRFPEPPFEGTFSGLKINCKRDCYLQDDAPPKLLSIWIADNQKVLRPKIPRTTDTEISIPVIIPPNNATS